MLSGLEVSQGASTPAYARVAWFALVISRTRPRTVPSAALVASIQVSASSRCCSWTAVSRGSGPGPPPETAELALTIGAAPGPVSNGPGPAAERSDSTMALGLRSVAATTVASSARPPVGRTSSGRFRVRATRREAAAVARIADC